jgi:hypothetical protein
MPALLTNMSSVAICAASAARASARAKSLWIQVAPSIGSS